MQQWVADAQTQRPLGQLPPDRLARRPHVVRQRPHRLRRHRSRVLRATCGSVGRRRQPRLPVRARRRRRDRGDVQRRRQGRSQGRLPAPVDAHDRADLHRRHHELVRSGDQRRQQGPRSSPTSRSPSSTAAASRARPRSFYDFVPARRARRVRRVGGAQPAARPNVRIIQLDSTPGFAPEDATR